MTVPTTPRPPSRPPTRPAAVAATPRLALVVALALLVAMLPVPVAAQVAPPDEPLTNLAHLDFLGDVATPPDQPGHTTYELDEQPTIGMLWTYADRREGGVYERIGGGSHDAATDTWSQGAYNADDISRAAIVYLRHHELFGDQHSLDAARELLRGLTYLQTVDGPDAGNVVLWMQPDGTLNPSAEPVELPDPSDSADSYWLARTIWALGEGYATFVDADPDFATFLDERMALSIAAVERERLDEFAGVTQVVDGLDWPAWLIADGADASSEAVYGLAAYLDAGGDAPGARDALAQLAEGIAMMQLGTDHQWPYRALMPWTQSRTIWHAWGDQMSGALAAASTTLGDAGLLGVATDETSSFTPHLLAQGGPENGWLPAPTDRTQIAYGTDATLQNLLAVGDASGNTVFHDLAGIAAAWYFGNNPAGEPMYDPATGRTYDGISPTGDVNVNSGAESTIHGLLSMLALDERPEVASWAMVASRSEHVTWQLVEAESGTWRGDAEVVTPADAWTGEGLWSGGAYVDMDGRATTTVTADLPTRDRQWVQPVFDRTVGAGQLVQVGVGGHVHGRPIDTGGAGDQGVTPTPGYFDVEGRLSAVAGPGPTDVEVRARVPRREVALDAVLVQPAVEWLTLVGDGRTQAVVRSFDTRVAERTFTLAGADAVTAVVHDAGGNRVGTADGTAGTLTLRMPPGGFAVVRSG